MLNAATSDWKEIDGGVFQGTLSGPELFRHVVSDLHTVIPGVKFVDDTTMVEASAKCTGPRMQTCVDQVANWSNENKLCVNK